MIKKGTYQTKGGYTARVDLDFNEIGGLAVIHELHRCVKYNPNGEFAFKDEDYSPEPNPRDSFDLIIESEKQS